MPGLDVAIGMIVGGLMLSALAVFFAAPEGRESDSTMQSSHRRPFDRAEM